MTSPLSREYQRLAAADTTRTLAYARLRQAVQLHERNVDALKRELGTR